MMMVATIALPPYCKLDTGKYTMMNVKGNKRATESLLPCLRPSSPVPTSRARGRPEEAEEKGSLLLQLLCFSGDR